MSRMTTPVGADLGVYTFGDRSENPNRPRTNYVFEVGGLRDPQSNRGFKKTYSDGRAGEVQKYMLDDPRVVAIADSILSLAYVHLRSSARDDSWLSFGIMDHHGIWIAPAIGEIVADRLVNAGYKVNLVHYDVKKEN